MSKRIKYLLSFFILLALIISTKNSLHAQCDTSIPSLQFSAIDTVVSEGSTFCIDITVRNFEDIFFFTTPINFNANILRLVSCSIDTSGEYDHPAIDRSFSCDKRFPLDFRGEPRAPNPTEVMRINDQIDAGFFNFSSGFLPVGFNIDDGGRLITLCFDVIGAVGDQTRIRIGDIPPFAMGTGTPLDIFNIKDGGTEVCIDPFLGGNITVGCISPTVSNPTVCPASPGDTNGSISFTICGGMLPYRYNLDGGPDTEVTVELQENIIEGLTSGSYNLNVIDAAGQTFLISNPITVGSGNPLVIDSILTQGPTCESALNLNATFINVFTSGGNGSEVFQWSNTGVNVNPQEQVDQGNYSVTVTDIGGCKAIEENIVVDYNELRMDVDIIQPICASDPADVTITVTGGQPQSNNRYNFFTDNGIEFLRRPSPFKPTNILAGQPIYFRAEDFTSANPQCFVETTFTITARKNIIIDLLPRNDGCSSGGVMNVNARLDPSGSTPLSNNLTFRILDDAGAEVDVITGPDTNVDFTNLPEGSYTVELTDNDEACTFINDDVIPPNSGAGLSISAVAVNPGCGQQGEITINVPSDPSNYTYLWEDGTSIVGNNVRSGLDAGNYLVTVTDNTTNCTGELDMRVELRDAGLPLDFNNLNEISLNAQEIPCNGDPSGALTYTITDQNLRAGATYTWERDGILIPGENERTLSGLGPGTYTVEINGDQICQSRNSYTFDPPTPLDLFIDQADTVCFGAETASFSARDLNGKTGLEITWQDTFTLNFLNPDNFQPNVPVSTYRVEAYHPPSDCRQDIIFDVEVYPEFNVAVSNQIDNVCASDSDGLIEVAVSGGSEDGNINYTWSDPNGPLPSTTNTINNLESGIYNLFVFDNICSVEDPIPFEVLGGDKISINLASTNIIPPSCFGIEDGSVQLAIDGLSGDINRISMDNTDTGAPYPSFDNTVTDLPAGEYSVRIFDTEGCFGIDTIMIQEPDLFTIEVDSANLQTLSCNSDNSGIIRTLVNGGNTGQRSYEWSHDPTLNNTIATNLPADIYTIYAQDARGCRDSTVYELTANVPITLDFTSLDSVQCFGDRSYFGNLSPAGGTNNGFRFSLGGTLMPVSDSILVSAGTYNLEIRDQDGCVLDTSFTIMQPPEVVVELGPDVEIELGDTYQLTAEHDPEEIITSYQWDTDESIDCLDCQTIPVTPDNDTVYGVTIENSDGCADEDEVTIRVRRSRNVFIPNVITTSNSNSNSSFKLFTGQGVERIEYLRIFDRHGNLVHMANQLAGSALGTADWDARLNGRLVESGVYVFMARVLFTDGEFLDYKGDITVIH